MRIYSDSQHISFMLKYQKQKSQKNLIALGQNVNHSKREIKKEKKRKEGNKKVEYIYVCVCVYIHYIYTQTYIYIHIYVYIHRVTKSRTRLSDFTFTSYIHILSDCLD